VNGPMQDLQTAQQLTRAVHGCASSQFDVASPQAAQPQEIVRDGTHHSVCMRAEPSASPAVLLIAGSPSHADKPCDRPC
jgi:hypothetical protein